VERPQAISLVHFYRLTLNTRTEKLLEIQMHTEFLTSSKLMLCRRCALAVSQGNDRLATDLLAELRLNSSPYGTATERLAHYLMEALVSWLFAQTLQGLELNRMSNI
jgi:hypothetical protein